jgi:predicted HTH transcriptional regulator
MLPSGFVLETGTLRKVKTIDELADIYLTLQKSNQKVTQKLLESNSNKSTKAIKKYWKEILEKVHNGKV